MKQAHTLIDLEKQGAGSLSKRIHQQQEQSRFEAEQARITKERNEKEETRTFLGLGALYVGFFAVMYGLLWFAGLFITP